MGLMGTVNLRLVLSEQRTGEDGYEFPLGSEGIAVTLSPAELVHTRVTIDDGNKTIGDEFAHALDVDSSRTIRAVIMVVTGGNATIVLFGPGTPVNDIDMGPWATGTTDKGFLCLMLGSTFTTETAFNITALRESAEAANLQVDLYLVLEDVS